MKTSVFAFNYGIEYFITNVSQCGNGCKKGLTDGAIVMLGELKIMLTSFSPFSGPQIPPIGGPLPPALSFVFQVQVLNLLHQDPELTTRPLRSLAQQGLSNRKRSSSNTLMASYVPLRDRLFDV